MYIRVFHENMFIKQKMAQPAPQVFGGYFEGIQKDFYKKLQNLQTFVHTPCTFKQKFVHTLCTFKAYLKRNMKR